jgi:acetyl esterase/lipase
MAKIDANIHPELRRALKLAPPFSVGPRTLWMQRRLLRLWPVTWPPRDVELRNKTSAGVRMRIYTPVKRAASMPGLLWIHGGGYLMGRPEMDDATCIEYARAVGVVVVSVDYRLAPEHPFPAGLDDCYAALRFMYTHARALGIDSARVAIGGSSAGGGLAAALAQLTHDRGEHAPIFQLLRYPMLDDRTARDTSGREHVMWSRPSNLFGWRSYLGSAWNAAEPPACAVPARRADLTGLPPAWIGVGSADLFHAEDVAYAHRLDAAGVECELYVVDGAFHGFDVIVSRAPISRAFRDAEIAVLRKYLGEAPP